MVAFAFGPPAIAASADAKAERQLEIAKRALHPDRFALTRAQRALDAVFHPQLTTEQYVRACVMYGVLFLARDDEVQAQSWFEKAFHKSDAITLEAVLGPAVLGYGPKINRRFVEMKTEFQRSRPALPTIGDRMLDPVAPPEAGDGNSERLQPVQLGNLLVEATSAIGPLELVVDGRQVGKTKRKVFGGTMLHLYGGQPPPGPYAIQIINQSGTLSTKFAVMIDAKKVTRVRITRAPPPPTPPAQPPPPAPAPTERPPNMLALASFAGAASAAVVTGGLSVGTLFVATSPAVSESDRRTLLVAGAVATASAMAGTAVLAVLGAFALLVEERAPAPAPVVVKEAPKPAPQAMAVAEVSESGKPLRRISLYREGVKP